MFFIHHSFFLQGMAELWMVPIKMVVGKGPTLMVGLYNNLWLENHHMVTF